MNFFLFRVRNQKCNQMTQEFHTRFSTHAYYFSDRNISDFRRFFRKWKSPLMMRQLTTEQRVFVVKHWFITRSIEQVRLLFRERFPDREPPGWRFGKM